MTFPPWPQLTQIGSSTILLPAALIIAIWLLATGSRQLAGWWCALFGGGLFLVVASKIAYIGWHIGAQSDFSGFSGHAFRAAAVIPLFFYLICADQSRVIRFIATWSGLGLAVLISWSRVVLHFHSMLEVISGWILGSVVCSVLIWRFEKLIKPPDLPRKWLAAGCLILLPTFWLPAMPSQRMIVDLACWFSGCGHLTEEKRRAYIGDHDI